MYYRLKFRGMRIKEPFSAISHGVGALIAMVFLGVVITLPDSKESDVMVLAYTVFGIGAVAVFVASTLYHALPLPLRWERRVRKLDQSAVYLMIAGTYTPVCLIGLSGTWGYSLLILIWTLAAVGIFNHWFWLGRGRRRPRLDAAIFLAMGWLCLLFAYPIVKALSSDALIWLVAGGLAYSMGALAYAVKWPNPVPKIIESHEVFHIFVLIGAACHAYLMLGPLVNGSL
jgi:hemolysin III